MPFVELVVVQFAHQLFGCTARNGEEMSEHSNPNSVAITCLQVAQTVITFDGAEWIAYRDAVRQCQSLQQRQEKQ
jgi:hypothetical protein